MATRSTPGIDSIGLLAGALAYLWWGLSPLFWSALDGIAATDIVAHRVLWALPFCAVLLLLRGHLGRALAALRDPRQLRLLAASAAVVSINWGLFVWAIGAGRVAEASLGYFMQPLVAVLIGFVFFRERLLPLQWLAIGLAAAGVLVYAAGIAGLPLVAVGISVSFAIYGALRKIVAVDSLDGLFIETLLLGPLALGWILWHDGAGLGRLGSGIDLLLLATGAFTAIPLIAFVSAARRLALGTLGVLFYLNPSCQFLLAVLWFDEPMGRREALAFALVWGGVLLYLLAMAQQLRRVRRMAGENA